MLLLTDPRVSIPVQKQGERQCLGSNGKELQCLVQSEDQSQQAIGQRHVASDEIQRQNRTGE